MQIETPHLQLESRPNSSCSPYNVHSATFLIATMAATEATAHARSLYRRVLRELPPRPLSSRASPRSSLHNSIRSHFSTPLKNSSSEYGLARRQETEQFIQYLKAQRMYGTLLERYNPGEWMDEEERVRLTARRVGMEMPVEFEWKPSR
jgi:ATP synthase assembly factor FMC1